MGFQDFLSELSHSGQIRILDAEKPQLTQVNACANLFESHANRCLLDLPASPSNPLLIRVVAMHWAALTLYRAAQFLVRREVEPDMVSDSLSVACPLPSDPNVCFSVDLYFRYLPDLISLSRGIAEKDPLVEGLLSLARQWPLSSVGVRGIQSPAPASLNPFLSHTALAQLYIDRIIETADASRLDDPRVHALLAQTVGYHPHLAGVLSDRLTTLTVTPDPLRT